MISTGFPVFTAFSFAGFSTVSFGSFEIFSFLSFTGFGCLGLSCFGAAALGSFTSFLASFGAFFTCSGFFSSFTEISSLMAFSSLRESIFTVSTISLISSSSETGSVFLTLMIAGLLPIPNKPLFP